MKEFRKMAAAMDQRVSQLTAKGILGPELMERMLPSLPDLNRIWTAASDRQLMALCDEYPGFYQYASMMEEAFEAQRKGPPAPYHDLPELPARLKQMLLALVSDGAALESAFQAALGSTEGSDTGRQATRLGELRRKWVADLDQFAQALKAAGIPSKAWDLVAPGFERTARRIAELESSLRSAGSLPP